MPRLDHIAVVVEDLDGATALFRDAFGLSLDRIEDIPERGVRIAFLTLGDTHVELVQPMDDDSEVSAWLEKHGEGLHHVAIAVDDVEGAVEKAETAGARPLPGAGRPGAGGTRVAFMHPKSTAGVLVELVQHGDR